MKPQEPPGAETLEIPLRRPYRDLVLSALFFAVCAAALAYRAWTNDRGLILNGIVTFEPGGADVFYAVLAILSGVFCAFGVLAAARFATLKEFRIVLGPRSITLPPTNALRDPREVTVPLHRIEAVELLPPARPITLVICEDERSHSIQRRWLTKGWSVQGVADAIIARVREAQASQRAGG